MTSTIVALDLETTGLDSNSDSITEIGAIRFRGNQIEAEWHSLINPGQRIPTFVTRLTGITNAMVREAPPIHAVIDELADFIGNVPILGHNIRFDIEFLRKHSILHRNDLLDTYAMASALMPNAGRYKLGSLAQALGIPIDDTHRALEDARLTQQIYLQLYQEALELPIEVLAEIVRLGDHVEEWLGYGLFFDALQARSKEVVPASKSRGGILAPLFEANPPIDAPPLQPLEPLVSLDPDEVASILYYGGAF